MLIWSAGDNIRPYEQHPTCNYRAESFCKYKKTGLRVSFVEESASALFKQLHTERQDWSGVRFVEACSATFR
jgi:hypothetical protein